MGDNITKTFSLNQRHLDVLDDLVRNGEFRDRSKALRAILEHYKGKKLKVENRVVVA